MTASEDTLDRIQDDAIRLLTEFASIESPTDSPEAVTHAQEWLRGQLESRGYRTRWVEGRGGGPHQLGVPGVRERNTPIQLILGHADTVWPIGTLEHMPVGVREGRLEGPGTFDMKAGIVSFLLALDHLKRSGRHPTVTPVLFVNADEETGSPTSRYLVRRLASVACRAWVLEPPLGPDGGLKTGRKSVLSVKIEARGIPAHAGLDPGSGASAIHELALMVPRLHALQDLDRGVSVNVGVIEGGTRSNVVAAHAHLRCDARTRTLRDAEDLVERIQRLEPENPRVRLEISARVAIPPMEATERNQNLWCRVREAATRIGQEVEGVEVGGASDGNVASMHTATLDGLGWIGDGAHAPHEHVVVDRIVERVLLLSELLMMPQE